MHRNVPGKVLGGVCAALSLQLGWDPVVVRAIFVASLAITAGMGLWIYALLWLVTPFEPRGKAPASKAVDLVSGLFKTEAPVEAHGGPTDL